MQWSSQETSETHTIIERWWCICKSYKNASRWKRGRCANSKRYRLEATPRNQLGRNFDRVFSLESYSSHTFLLHLSLTVNNRIFSKIVFCWAKVSPVCNMKTSVFSLPKYNYILMFCRIFQRNIPIHLPLEVLIFKEQGLLE